MYRISRVQEGVGVLDHPVQWFARPQDIMASVRRHHPDGHRAARSSSAGDEVAFREEMISLMALDELKMTMTELALDVLLIRGFDIPANAAPERNALLHAFSCLFGYPTPAEARTNCVVWDVKARPVANDASRFTTFSERTGEAMMHTDCSFHDTPEAWFLLYSVRAARCRGGLSRLLRVDDVLETLCESRKGRSALVYLTEHEVPFRVPSVFSANERVAEVRRNKVFWRNEAGEGWGMRWRYDAIIKGCEQDKAGPSSAMLESILCLNDVIERQAPKYCCYLRDGDLLIANNTRVLHGRSDYVDPSRHLLRVRMADAPGLRTNPRATDTIERLAG